MPKTGPCGRRETLNTSIHPLDLNLLQNELRYVTLRDYLIRNTFVALGHVLAWITHGHVLRDKLSRNSFSGPGLSHFSFQQ
jgi:hypothetical protein